MADPVQFRSTRQLQEAQDITEDWTGKTDPKARRRLQNRLHQRQWRRKKAAERAGAAFASIGAGPSTTDVPTSNDLLAAAFNQATTAIAPQSVLPARPRPPPPSASPATFHDLMSFNLNRAGGELPCAQTPRPTRHPGIGPHGPHIHFPLSPDHYLLTLVQYNVLRGIFTNLALCSMLHTVPPGCLALLIPTIPPPSSVPPIFRPTTIQLSTPHRPWLESVPCPQLRDNLILATSAGLYDEDEMCEDMCGGLFDEYPDCPAQQQGFLVWGDPWRTQSWEMSKGFVEKWSWLLKGCSTLLESTNKYREQRGEERLVVEIE